MTYWCGMADGFNFNKRARQVIAAAGAKATRQHLAAVGIEQLLAALLHEPDAETTAIFAQLNIDVHNLLEGLTEVVNTEHAQTATQVVPPYTARAKKALEFAMTEAHASTNKSVAMRCASSESGASKTNCSATSHVTNRSPSTR